MLCFSCSPCSHSFPVLCPLAPPWTVSSLESCYFEAGVLVLAADIRDLISCAWQARSELVSLRAEAAEADRGLHEALAAAQAAQALAEDRAAAAEATAAEAGAVAERLEMEVGQAREEAAREASDRRAAMEEVQLVHGRAADAEARLAAFESGQTQRAAALEVQVEEAAAARASAEAEVDRLRQEIDALKSAAAAASASAAAECAAEISRLRKVTSRQRGQGQNRVLEKLSTHGRKEQWCA